MARTQITAESLASGAVTADKIAAGAVTAGKIAEGAAGSNIPKIAQVQITDSSYTVLDDTAVALEGGYIKITGTGFASGCSVIVGTTTASSTTFVSSTEVRAQVQAQSAGTYIVYVVNSDGGTATRINGLTYSASPIWTTASTLPEATSNAAYTQSLVATGATSYSLQAGSSLPAGMTLTSGGLLSGTNVVANNTAYSFTILATDAELQDSPRTFNLNVNVASPTSSIQYMVVAGGGGGGGNRGGGGGAGGLLTGSTSITTGAVYSITVGQGGASATNGSNSSLTGTGVSVTTIGGGRGGSNDQADGSAGGSGGGAGSLGPRSGGAGTSGQGSAGGSSQYGVGAGGGGAGGVGGSTSGSTSYGAFGGPGVVGLDGLTYAAGGNGGDQIDGGFAEGRGVGGENGASNTGNGGNGGSGGVAGGAGGSGVVIIRYSSNSAAAVSTTGSPTVTVSDGYRYYKFTGNGSITF